MIDQEILDFIADAPEGRQVGEECIRNFQIDVVRTIRTYDVNLEHIRATLKDCPPKEFKKFREHNRKSLEIQLKEINKEIQQVQEALKKRKDQRPRISDKSTHNSQSSQSR